MKRSKYLYMKSGDWECTHVGLASITSVYSKRKINGKCKKNTTPGHRNYYYIFERFTSDSKAMKMIRLNASQINKVRKGEATVEDFAKKKAAEKSQAFKDKVSYSFI